MDDIKKEIVAFANCNGGRLYMGVRDDGTVIGLDNPDETALQISNMVRDAIKPDITMFLHYETLEENGRQIVAVDVQRMRCLNQDLTFETARKEFGLRGVEFGLQQMRTLKLLDHDGIFIIWPFFCLTNVFIPSKPLFSRELTSLFSKTAVNLPVLCCSR